MTVFIRRSILRFGGAIESHDSPIGVLTDQAAPLRERVLSDATKYAMGALKHSLHSCYFCYHGRTAALEEEVDFFRRRLGASRTLIDLLALRGEYRRSFRFVIGGLPALARLHLRTARDNRFPLGVRGE
jgi:hypothetical protein